MKTQLEFPYEHHPPSGPPRRMLIQASIHLDFDPNYGADADGNRGQPTWFPPEVEIQLAWLEIESEEQFQFIRGMRLPWMQTDDGTKYVQVEPFAEDGGIFSQKDRLQVRQEAINEFESSPETWPDLDDRDGEY